jgi:DNA-binding NarL/FixJ family response regulator
LLEVLAVGEPLSLQSAQRLAPEASVPDLERRGLVVVGVDNQRPPVRLAHPLFSEALRAAMPVSLHRQISHDLAEELAGTGGLQPGGTLRLALLREAAGEPVDPGLLAEAARNANTLLDHQLAERLAGVSMSAGGGFSAQLELGRALLGQSRFDEAEAALAPLVGNEPNDTARERLADAVLLTLGFGLGRIDDTLWALERIERDASDHVVKAILRCQRAALLAFGARFTEAAELGLAALDSVDDESVRLRSITSVGTSLVMAGRIEEALTLNDAALEPSWRLQDRLPRAPAWVLSSRCTALFFAGRADEALGLLDLAMREASKVPSHMVAEGNASRGRLLLFQGRVLGSLRFLNDALVTLRHNPAREPSWCLALAAEAYALRGQHQDARAAVAEAVGLRRSELVVFQPDELRALAWVDAQDGRISSAIEQLWAAADLAASRGQRSFELIILHDLLRLGEHRAAERALRLAEHVDGAWSGAIAAHAVGVRSTKAADLETAAEAFTAIGSSLVGAELWANASAARQREGLPARAAQAARYSAELVERCEGARTPSLTSAVALVPLSRRERETARLAASGATNAMIATELSLSVRTVESHLYFAFAKLGITDRSQLAEVLGEG